MRITPRNLADAAQVGIVLGVVASNPSTCLPLAFGTVTPYRISAYDIYIKEQEWLQRRFPNWRGVLNR
jgi:hypothetical protein